MKENKKRGVLFIGMKIFYAGIDTEWELL